MANAAEAAEVGLDVLKMVWSNVRTAVSLPGQVRTTVMEFLHRLFPRMRFEAHLFHELGARVARAATAMLCAASSAVCTIRTLLVDSAISGTQFLLSDSGRQSVAGLACGAAGVCCLFVAAHPNWGSVQTEAVASCAVSVGCVVTAARHLEISATIPQRYLIAAGGAAGAALGCVLVYAYRSLQRAKVPLYSFVSVIGGMALLVDGAILVSDS